MRKTEGANDLGSIRNNNALFKKANPANTGPCPVCRGTYCRAAVMLRCCATVLTTLACASNARVRLATMSLQMLLLQNCHSFPRRTGARKRRRQGEVQPSALQKTGNAQHEQEPQNQKNTVCQTHLDGARAPAALAAARAAYVQRDWQRGRTRGCICTMSLSSCASPS